MKILTFGIATEIMGTSVSEIKTEPTLKVSTLKNILEIKYPELKNLGSYMIAINNRYSQEDTLISENDEIAIIPPVSGG